MSQRSTTAQSLTVYWFDVDRGGKGSGKGRLIKPAGKYRRTTFIFSALIIQLGSPNVRLFLPLSQIETRNAEMLHARIRISGRGTGNRGSV